MTMKKIRVKLIGADAHTAYVALPGYPETIESGFVERTIVLHEIIEYSGPRVHLDFNKGGVLIGIEILASMGEGDEDERAT
jgi:hypothetical protein